MERLRVQGRQGTLIFSGAECTQCFDSHDLPAGIDVCLSCFNGACPPEINGVASANAHGRSHYEKTGHAVVVNVQRRRKPQSAEAKKSKRVSQARFGAHPRLALERRDSLYR